MLIVQKLAGQLLDGLHLIGVGVHLLVESVETRLQNLHLLDVISGNHGVQQFLLKTSKLKVNLQEQGHVSYNTYHLETSTKLVT